MKANAFDHIRQQFPILEQQINNHALVYLDNGATTQKPQSVMDAINHYYQFDNSNIHRGVHQLSQRATEQYEAARDIVKNFLHAKSAREIVFTRGTTESINLVAQSFVKPLLSAGDEVLITHMEHHSNIVPWQMICEETAARLKVIPVNDIGELDLSQLPALINSKTKFLALTHVSNVLGTINPIKEIIDIAHQHNVCVLVDGAQAVAHVPMNVQEFDV